MDKKPRAIVMADNWKTKEIKLVLAIRDEMVDFSIDPNLIQEYLDEEYERINIMYDEKIKKHQDKMNNIKTSNNNKKRKEAIKFIIKNKEFLEERGFTKEYIENYMNKHYNIVCKRYSDTSKITSNEKISFID